MAEILLKARDHVSSDPSLNKQLYKRGDIVCIQPDNHPWTPTERDRKLFCIIHVPRVKPAALQDLLVNGQNHRRKRWVDLESIPMDAQKQIRKGRVVTIPLKRLQASLAKEKESVTDGNNSNQNS